MSRKTFLAAYTASILLFCAALGWREYKRENERTYKVTITPNHVSSTSTSLISAITTKAVVSDDKNSTHSTDFTTTLAFTTITTSVEVVTESNEEIEEIYIDINNADIDELIRLDGIGESLAARIIDYREENGGFDNIEEIMNVYGIGEGIFYSIADFIYVENPVYESQPEEDENEEYSESEVSEEVSVEEPTEPTEPPLTLEDIAPIELNHADIEQLMLLPYVDEEIAQKIIELRDAIHGFSHPYEIAYIEELSDMQAAEIVKYVYVENSES